MCVVTLLSPFLVSNLPPPPPLSLSCTDIQAPTRKHRPQTHSPLTCTSRTCPAQSQHVPSTCPARAQRNTSACPTQTSTRLRAQRSSSPCRAPQGLRSARARPEPTFGPRGRRHALLPGGKPRGNCAAGTGGCDFRIRHADVSLRSARSGLVDGEPGRSRPLPPLAIRLVRSVRARAVTRRASTVTIWRGLSATRKVPARRTAARWLRQVEPGLESSPASAGPPPPGARRRQRGGGARGVRIEWRQDGPMDFDSDEETPT